MIDFILFETMVFLAGFFIGRICFLREQVEELKEISDRVDRMYKFYLNEIGFK